MLRFFFFFPIKPLSPNPTLNHSAAKQPAFSPSLPEHVYQNCFGEAGGAGDWNSSLQCLSLKFENLWDAAVMKSWNPSVLLPESLPGETLNRKRVQSQKRFTYCDLAFIIYQQGTCWDHPSLTCPSLLRHLSATKENSLHCPPLCLLLPPHPHHCPRHLHRHHHAPLQKPKSRRKVGPKRSVSIISRMPSWRPTGW